MTRKNKSPARESGARATAPAGAGNTPHPHYTTNHRLLSTTELLQTILAQLDRGDCPDARWPNRKGEYWALCPFHPDRQTGSFSVGERGYKCFACGASGDLQQLARHLGVDVLTRCSGGNKTPPPPA